MKVTLTDFSGTGPVLVLGPSLGTRVASLWRDVVPLLVARFHVLGWDLPGHGLSPATDMVTIVEIAGAVLAEVDGPFSVAGVSIGGIVSLQLLLSAPDRVTAGTLLCTGAKIGESQGWQDRAALVRRDGLAAVQPALQDRWFAPSHRRSDLAQTLLAELTDVDAGSYAALCEALGHNDLRPALADVGQPVLAVAGAHDPVASPAMLRHLATGVQHGRLVVLESAGHLAPAEEPAAVAALLLDETPGTTTTTAQVRAQGMRIRREVLGDRHVDRASAAADGLISDFQDLITRYAWGEIWSRPGLDRRTRSMLTLTVLAALGHERELAMHVRAAVGNGVTPEEINEVLLHTAIYAGVPASNTAFAIAREVLAEIDQENT